MNAHPDLADLPSEDLEAGAEREALLDFLYLCPHGMVEFDAAGDIALINPAAMRLLAACSPAAASITNIFEALAPQVRDLQARMAADPRPRGLILDGFRVEPAPAARRAPLPDGGPTRPAADPLVMSLTIRRFNRNRLMAVLSDISAVVARERQLREAEAWFAAIMNAGAEYAFCTIDTAGRIADWNISCERLFGRSAAEVLGAEADRVPLLVPTPGSGFAAHLAAARRDGWQVTEGWMARAGGEPFWGTAVISVLRGDEPDDPPVAFLVVIRDTTERRSSVEAVRRGLCLDHLTGVLNRRHFLEVAEQAFAATARSGQPLSVIMVDADHFKAVNDTLGHAAGDAVLVELAALLEVGIRTGRDHVGRLGGEEFCILLPGSKAADAAKVAERLRGALAAARIAVGPEGAATIGVTASFGVAARGDAMPHFAELLAAADRALYAAKAQGRNRVVLAEPGRAGT